MSSIFPAVPDPQATVESLAEAVRTLKINIELLTGQRPGASPARTFVQTSAPTALAVGDRWVDGSGVERYWTGTDWLKPSIAQPSVQTLLDGISSTRGTVLYRGASAWSALASGTAGQVLTTGGAGADPSWSGSKVLFGAYHNTTQAIGASAWTKIAFNTEEFDNNSNFASDAFTPTVAGYYQLNASVFWGGALVETSIALYKNGSLFKRGVDADYGFSVGLSTLVYANGTTDAFTVYAWTKNAQNASGGQSSTYFNGALIAPA